MHQCSCTLGVYMLLHSVSIRKSPLGLAKRNPRYVVTDAATGAQVMAAASSEGVAVDTPTAPGASVPAGFPDDVAATAQCGVFKLAERTRLTAPEHAVNDQHVVLEGETGLVWRPGDVAEVWPCNPAAKAADFARYLGFDPAQRVCVAVNANGDDDPADVAPFGAPADGLTIGELFEAYLDIFAMPGRAVFELLGLYASTKVHREKLEFFASPEGASALRTYCFNERCTFPMVMSDFASARVPSLALVLELIPRMQPRAFSIAGGSATRIELCVGVVEYTTPLGRRRRGVCTNWLATAPVGSAVPVAIAPGEMAAALQRAGPAAPLVLIGPGTGIAPCRALWQAHAETRVVTVFFGCRSRELDLLYGAEMRALAKRDNCTVHVAFSRENPEQKVYVTHLMGAQTERLWAAVERGGVFFVSGRQGSMPREVGNALRRIMVSAGGLSVPAADDLFADMIRENRFVEDTWA